MKEIFERREICFFFHFSYNIGNCCLSFLLNSMQGFHRAEGLVQVRTEMQKPEEGHSTHFLEREQGQGWTSNFFDGLISISGCMLALGLPIFFTGMTFQGIALDRWMYFYFWMLLGLVAWASLGVITGEMKIRRTPLDIPLLGFLVVYGVSALLSVDKWHSFFGFFGDPSRGFLSVLAVYFAYYFFASQFTLKRFFWMAGAFITSSVVVIFWSLLVVRGIHFMPASWEAYAPLSLLGSVSGLAAFLGMVLPIFITAVFFVSKTAFAPVRYALLSILGLGIVSDIVLLSGLHSYVPWVAVIAGIAFFLIFILAQVVRPDERLTWVPMLAFVLLLIGAAWGSDGLVKARLPVEIAPDMKLSWEVAKGSIQEHFFFGSGPATYGYNFSLFKPEAFNTSSVFSVRFYDGSNALFEAVSTIGIVGSIFFFVVVFSYASVGLYLLTRERKHDKLLSLSLWSASLVFIITFFSARVAGPFLLIGLVLGIFSLILLLHESDSETSWLHLSFKAAPKFALTLAFIFMVVSAGVAMLFVFMGKVVLADISAGKAVRTEKPSVEGSMTNLLRAIRYYPKEGRYYARLGQEQLILAIQEARKSPDVQDSDRMRGLLTGAIDSSKRVADELMPNDVASVESAGLIYENVSAIATGDREALLGKAKEYYERALLLDPKNPLLYLKIGQVTKALSDIKPEGNDKGALLSASEEALKKSISLKENFPVAHYSMAVVKAAQKDIDAAIDHASQAVKFDSKNLTYRYNLGILYQVRDMEGDSDKAEVIFKEILSQNERLIDVRLSLGLLYEKKKKQNDAIAAYEKGVELLREGDNSNRNFDNLRQQIEKMIDTVRRGGSNLGKPVPQADTAQASEGNPIPESSASVPEVNQNPSIQESVPSTETTPVIEPNP